jgi:hypothetical protein
MKRAFSILACALALDVALIFIALGSARAVGDLVVYADALETSFQDWSWATHSLAATAPVYAGTRSTSVTYAGNWDGVWFVNASGGIDTSSYTALHFAIHGGSNGGQSLRVQADSGNAYPANSVDLSAYLPGGPVANQWRVVEIPLSALNMQNTMLGSIAFQSNTSTSQPTFYLDDIRLIAAPMSTTNAAVRINTLGTPQTFDARLLGTNLPAWLGATRFSNATVRARLSASGVTLVRIPGGSWGDDYDWLNCENGLGNCSWASRPTDFINILRATDRQALYIINVNDTSKKSAALVAFFNARITDTTPIGMDIRGTDWYTAGHWAQLRASHGNPEPFYIQYWDFGNEIFGATQAAGGAGCASYGWENAWTCDGTQYVNGVGSGASRHEGYLEVRNAMRAVDSSIWVGAVGVGDSAAWGNWDNKVVAAAGAVMDYYVIHQYAYFNLPSSYDLALAQPQSIWSAMRTNLQTTYNTHAGGRAIPTIVDEYNLISPQEQDNSQWMTRAVNTLFIADTIGQIAQNNFVMANQWDFMNGAAGNGTDYGLLHADTYTRMPQYYVFPLWARFGSQMLPVTSTLSAATMLSVYAGRIDSQTVSLLAINKTGSSITTTITLAGAPLVTSGTADVVKATALGDQSVTFNGASNPSNDLSSAPPTVLTNLGNPLTYIFAPYSVTLLRMNLGTTSAITSSAYLPFVIK